MLVVLTCIFLSTKVLKPVLLHPSRVTAKMLIMEFGDNSLKVLKPVLLHPSRVTAAIQVFFPVLTSSSCICLSTRI